MSDWKPMEQDPLMTMRPWKRITLAGLFGATLGLVVGGPVGFAVGGPLAAWLATPEVPDRRRGRP